MHLMLIEYQAGASDLLAQRLGGSGFQITQVGSFEAALAHVNAGRAAALVVDQTLGNASPASMVQPLRDAGIGQPLLVLSPRGAWRDKVDALDAGADDYVFKPVRSEEVAARLRAIIRRSSGQPSNRITKGGLDLDLKARCALLNGRCLYLTRNEFRLVQALMLGQHHVVTRDAIRAALGADGAGLTDNAVEVQVARLRRKVGNDLIKTIRGVGYRLEVPEVRDGADAVDRDPCRKGSGGKCQTC